MTAFGVIFTFGDFITAFLILRYPAAAKVLRDIVRCHPVYICRGSDRFWIKEGCFCHTVSIYILKAKRLI